MCIYRKQSNGHVYRYLYIHTHKYSEGKKINGKFCFKRRLPVLEVKISFLNYL